MSLRSSDKEYSDGGCHAGQVEVFKDECNESADNVFYAHSKEGAPVEKWQKLETHLKNVAGLAGEFADVFEQGNGDMLRIMATWEIFRTLQRKLIRRIPMRPQKKYPKESQSFSAGTYAMQKLPRDRPSCLT